MYRLASVCGLDSAGQDFSDLITTYFLFTAAPNKLRDYLAYATPKIIKEPPLIHMGSAFLRSLKTTDQLTN